MKHNKQKDHYELIHNDYEDHYYDPTSMEYRERFIYDVMFKGVDLNGKRIADLASGSGHNSLAILKRFPDAKLTGFDISPKACSAYRENLSADSFEVDLTKPLQGDIATFDCVFIFGGLHHCVSDMKTTLANISKLLKPEGLLLFFEPNAQYILEGARKLWYKHDRYFEEETEAALDHSKLLELSKGQFRQKSVTYVGGVAFFLVYNSLVFRIPLKVKKYIAPPLFALELLTNCLPGRFFYSSFVGQWIKN